MTGQQEHWDEVAQAIEQRLAELDMTQQELATHAGVALTTVRELRRNRLPRRRNPRTLAAISEALQLPSAHLDAIARGQSQPRQSLDEQLVEIRSRLDALEREIMRR